MLTTICHASTQVLKSLGLAAVIVLTACGRTPVEGNRACILGEYTACTCNNGGVGAQVCSAEGTLGPCVCTDDCLPATCASLHKGCGAVPDGCGGYVSCGTCPDGETCGGGGAANVCGASSCTPSSCAAQEKDCGVISDGCGSVLSCGTCG